MSTKFKPYIIGIAGPSCSGKTTASKKISEYLQRKDHKSVVVIGLDNFYIGGGSGTNYDEPGSLHFDELCKHIRELQEGKTVYIPNYNFKTHSREPDTTKIEPALIIIIEGILIFNNLELLNLMDLKIFVEANDLVCYQRRLNRDVKDRGRTEDEVINRYMRDVFPSNVKYVNPSKSMADIILMNNTEHKFIGLDILMPHIERKLEEMQNIQEVCE